MNPLCYFTLFLLAQHVEICGWSNPNVSHIFLILFHLFINSPSRVNWITGLYLDSAIFFLASGDKFNPAWRCFSVDFEPCLYPNVLLAFGKIL